MKSTGNVRRVDNLGRVVIPIELRRKLDIGDNDGLEIMIDNEKIILRKFVPACVFCGSVDAVATFRNKNVCGDCLAVMKNGVAT